MSVQDPAKALAAQKLEKIVRELSRMTYMSSFMASIYEELGGVVNLLADQPTDEELDAACNDALTQMVNDIETLSGAKCSYPDQAHLAMETALQASKRFGVVVSVIPLEDGNFAFRKNFILADINDRGGQFADASRKVEEIFK